MSNNLSNEEKARLYDEMQKKEERDRAAALAKKRVTINWFWFTVGCILIIIVAAIYLSESSEPTSTPTLSGQGSNYIKKYSGSYNIGQDAVELYVLKDDGTCTWTWTSSSGDTQEKDGSWSAKEGYIRIAIDGSIGTVVEEYFLTDGKFVTKENSNRFLIKR